jgi:hypothetical protein
MTIWTKCPGCGHNYGWGIGEESSPNENGYCGWCRAEGVHSKADQARVHVQAQLEYEKQQALEEEKWRNDNGDWW